MLFLSNRAKEISMKTLTIAALAAVVSLGLWAAGRDRTPDVDTIVSGSIPARPAGHSYTITNSVAKTACLAERGAAISGRSTRFTAGPDCDAVWPGLAGARTWTQNGDGTVDVLDARGEALLTVVDGDGLAYEAVEPANAMITFVAAD